VILVDTSVWIEPFRRSSTFDLEAAVDGAARPARLA
jgi:hypothetical protein